LTAPLLRQVEGREPNVEGQASTWRASVSIPTPGLERDINVAGMETGDHLEPDNSDLRLSMFGLRPSMP
jgi:hypothetical protein